MKKLVIIFLVMINASSLEFFNVMDKQSKSVAFCGITVSAGEQNGDENSYINSMKDSRKNIILKNFKHDSIKEIFNDSQDTKIFVSENTAPQVQLLAEFIPLNIHLKPKDLQSKSIFKPS